MTTTLATKKQSQAIRQKMAEIRTELPYSADAARHDVRKLADWKYHMSKRPLPFLAVAALVGYVIVPKAGRADAQHPFSDTSQSTTTRHGSEGVGVSKPVAKGGLIGGFLGTVSTIALQQVASLAAKQAENWFAGGDKS